MLQQIDWLVLVASLPTRNTAARMRLWRALKALGSATLRDGVYLLPMRDESGTALHTLADEVRAAEGSAEVLHVAADGAQDAAFRSLFDRGPEYAALMAEIRSTVPDEKALRRLKRDFAALAATDYFPDDRRDAVRQALSDLQASLSPGEPRTEGGAIRRLVCSDFHGRTWATRKHLWVDRMASAWLIRRFIDPQASFLWLDSPTDCPPDVLGFDFDGAAFTHVGERVSFEVLAASFGLADDPSIARIAAIVHCLDVGGVMVAEAAGIEAVLGGLRASAPDDDSLLVQAGNIFDSLYQRGNSI